jgi:hypothetical protein
MKIHKVYGYLQSLCVSFLLNLCLDPGPIYLTTNTIYEGAETMMGGNGVLTEEGELYASMLNQFFDQEKDKWLRKGWKSCKIYYSPRKAMQATVD